MLLFLKKKQEEAKPDSAEVVELAPDFIPYYGHANPHTLLTKNGELMQTIRIASSHSGVDYEAGDSTDNTVRHTLRQAIAESITDPRFSLWIHTLRKRRLVRHGGKFEQPFAAYINEEWRKKNRWDFQYYNEVYVSVLREGQSAAINDKKNLKSVVLPRTNRRYRNSYLEQSAQDLDYAVSSLLEKIRVHYDARRLSIVERIPSNMPALAGQAIMYSEPMEFLGQLLNLRVDRFLLPEADISTALSTGALTFGFNALSIRYPSGKRRFGAMLSLKQYRDMPSESIDKLLQAPLELIVTEAFHFMPAAQALVQYNAQKELFSFSGDNYSIKNSGLQEMLAADKKTPVDFAAHQVNVLVMADDFKHLDSEVAKAQKAFSDLGLVIVREDMRMEECFWGQLPGNFEFLRREDPMCASKVAGFARLNLYPNGSSHNNHWGESTALIPTRLDSPYFFNFHWQDNGHTVLFDFNSFHDPAGRVLTHFLLNFALKFRGRTFIFDRNHSARLWFHKADGRYYSFSSIPGDDKTLRLNPFSLEDNKRNRAFLLAWCVSLAELKAPVSDGQKTIMQSAIEQLYAAPTEQRTMVLFVEKLNAVDPPLAAILADFHGRGKYAGWFDASQETFDLKQALSAFDMDLAVQQPGLAVPVFSYLLHRIVSSLDGKPTLIVIHNAIDLLENPFFAPRLESLLEMLTQNNAMMLFTVRSPEEHANSRIIASFMKACSTRLYVPDDIPVDYASEEWGVTLYDAKLLSRMERQKGDFLLRQGHDSIALRVNMEGMDDARAIFANDIKSLIAAGGRFASLPQEE